MLTLYNTLTRQKEPFIPLDETNVRMYVCGPTVYARPHIGNARSVVVYDVLYRLLRHLYGAEHVTYVRNITDVDDKINAAAIERGISIQQLTQEVTGWFHDDMDALNCLRPTYEPRATQYIPQMIAMIEKLIANGNAYVSQRHVLFSVESRVQSSESSWVYGMLSGRIAEEQQAGARVAVESYKKNPGDFVLWKPADAEDDASSKFPSPWGVGRPGWHIECSAMSTDLLGKDFDIHGGGADLKFPHHENEIAQSRCAHPDSVYARTWVHNGFLTVNGEKMSKSLGNFITVRDLLDKGVHGEVIRLALLSAKYNEPINWTDKLVDDAKKQLEVFYEALYPLGIPGRPGSVHSLQKLELWLGRYETFLENGDWNDDLWTHPSAKTLEEEFFNALSNDLNIPLAVSKLHSMSKIRYQGGRDTMPDIQPHLFFSYRVVLKKCANTLGLATKTHSQFKEAIHIQKTQENIMEASFNIEQKITARTEAKATKNWAEADRIRDELKAQGIILEDRPDGMTDWRHA